MSNNLFFLDSDETLLPREQVRIAALTAEPYPDGTRVRMQIEITPFQERPNLEIFARKVDGPIVAEMSVIQTMTPHLEFTLHIRGVETHTGSYTLRVELFYADRLNPQDVREVEFQIAAIDPSSEE
jgi:hypothetical protein